MSNLYSKEIIEHYRNPRNFQKLKKFTHKSHVANSVCGDELDLYLNVEEGKVKGVGFQGSGCAICLGSMSMFSERILEKSLPELQKVEDETVLDIVGMDKSSPRHRCATLSVEAVQAAIGHHH
jgi:nitrogen fixation NifU-like protein